MRNLNSKSRLSITMLVTVWVNLLFFVIACGKNVNNGGFKPKKSLDTPIIVSGKAGIEAFSQMSLEEKTAKVRQLAAKILMQKPQEEWKDAEKMKNLFPESAVDSILGVAAQLNSVSGEQGTVQATVSSVLGAKTEAASVQVVGKFKPNESYMSVTKDGTEFRAACYIDCSYLLVSVSVKNNVHAAYLFSVEPQTGIASPLASSLGSRWMSFENAKNYVAASAGVGPATITPPVPVPSQTSLNQQPGLIDGAEEVADSRDGGGEAAEENEKEKSQEGKGNKKPTVPSPAVGPSPSVSGGQSATAPVTSVAPAVATPAAPSSASAAALAFVQTAGAEKATPAAGGGGTFAAAPSAPAAKLAAAATKAEAADNKGDKVRDGTPAPKAAALPARPDWIPQWYWDELGQPGGYRDQKWIYESAEMVKKQQPVENHQEFDKVYAELSPDVPSPLALLFNNIYLDTFVLRVPYFQVFIDRKQKFLEVEMAVSDNSISFMANGNNSEKIKLDEKILVGDKTLLEGGTFIKDLNINHSGKDIRYFLRCSSDCKTVVVDVWYGQLYEDKSFQVEIAGLYKFADNSSSNSSQKPMGLEYSSAPKGWNPARVLVFQQEEKKSNQCIGRINSTSAQEDEKKMEECKKSFEHDVVNGFIDIYELLRANRHPIRPASGSSTPQPQQAPTTASAATNTKSLSPEEPTATSKQGPASPSTDGKRPVVPKPATSPNSSAKRSAAAARAEQTRVNRASRARSAQKDQTQKQKRRRLIEQSKKNQRAKKK